MPNKKRKLNDGKVLENKINKPTADHTKSAMPMPTFEEEFKSNEKKIKPDLEIKSSDKSIGKEMFWLMKSEPESRIENGHEMKFGIDDLKSSKNQTTHWDGVRNYEARNHMKSMKLGQQAFFYHSNCKNPGL